MRSGLYRVRGVGGLPDDIRVNDDGIELPLEERLYRLRGYLPPVEELLWQEDFAAEKDAAEGAALFRFTCRTVPHLRHTGEGRYPPQPWVPAFAGTTRKSWP
ncbi:MAG TPA: hypothetical protein VMF86_16565 [Stellaceae bacterium]|nr:hypothetical protein [Stellaceae bacterium]